MSKRGIQRGKQRGKQRANHRANYRANHGGHYSGGVGAAQAHMPVFKPKSIGLTYLYFIATITAFILPALIVLGRAGADIGVSIIACSYLLHCLISRDVSWFARWEVRWLAAFWLLLVLSNCLQIGQDPHIVKALLYIRFLICYVALRFWIFTSPDIMLRAALWALPVLAFVVIDGWWQYMDGSVSLTGRLMRAEERLTGPFSHPNLGNYLFKCLLPMAIVWWATLRAKPKLRAFAIGVAALGLLLIPLSGERSITVMLMVSFLAFALLSSIFVACHRRVIFISVALVMLCIAMLSTQAVIVQRADLFILQVSEFWDTVYGQLFYASILLWQQSPLIGHGVEVFSRLCGTLHAQGVVTYCDIHPHNTYLQLLVTTGILGFAAMVAMLCTLVYHSVMRVVRYQGSERFLAVMQLSLLVGLLFPAVVTQDFFSNWPATLFWFSLAWIISLHHIRTSHDG